MTVQGQPAVQWLVAFLSRHGLAVFGWYRLALSVVLGLLIWSAVVEFNPDESCCGHANGVT